MAPNSRVCLALEQRAGDKPPRYVKTIAGKSEVPDSGEIGRRSSLNRHSRESGNPSSPRSAIQRRGGGQYHTLWFTVGARLMMKVQSENNSECLRAAWRQTRECAYPWSNERGTSPRATLRRERANAKFPIQEE